MPEDAFDLAASLRLQAHANRLANHRLHAAMAPLTRTELQAPRTSFFPSLMATLNHLLQVDQYYLDCLHGVPDADQSWARREVFADLAALAQAQRVSDERLIAYCGGLRDANHCTARVAMPRGQGRIQTDGVCHVLAHLFMHQTHHRGQLHAMLSGTGVPPPQLDEFLMPSEAHLRVADLAALGWHEAQVYPAPALDTVPAATDPLAPA
jgi:uncharacterized damage-inducible protein DinB